MSYLQVEKWQPFIAIFLITFFLIWESFVPFLKQPKERITHGAKNIILAIINAIIIGVLFSGITLIVANYTEENNFGFVHLFNLSELQYSILAFIIMDMWNYTWHRINHGTSFLWRFHKMHHSDPNMNVTTSVRLHFGEIIISSALRLVVIFLVGIPIWVLIFYDTTLLICTIFHHSNIQLPGKVDKLIRTLIVSPNMHKVHHSRIKIETDSNYSSFLTIWDRIFGSFMLIDDYSKIEFGLDNYDGEEKQSLIGLIKTPLSK
ncbi:MAG TPA: sterol desaturase family protein [Ignavibacteria bacterium]|mgnify:CR=1 FL=1|nr:sterol desaturase family protein [Ignavibacteria bacterium]